MHGAERTTGCEAGSCLMIFSQLHSCNCEGGPTRDCRWGELLSKLANAAAATCHACTHTFSA